MFLGHGAPQVAVSLTAPDLEGLLDQVRRARERGAELLEWRADMAGCLDEPAQAATWCRTLQEAAAPTPVLFTLRTHTEGGRAELAPQAYAALVQAVVAAGAADLVDVEASQPVAAHLIGAAQQAGLAVVASHHNLTGTLSAAEIIDVLEGMQRAGASIAKVAFAASSYTDALRCMAAASAYANRPDAVPVVAIAMGEHGAFSRVLAQSFHGAFTFASLDEASAPGQLPLPQTRAFVAKMSEAFEEGRYSELAAINLLRPDCRLVVLLGKPVAHSLSPAIHNLSFSQEGLDALYVTAECDKADLPQAMAAFAANPAWVGCNVTMPCKQEVIRHLDGLDDASALIGAVNTVAKAGRKLRGYNTDGVGFVASLRDAHVEVAGKHVCILGAGGAASAVAAQCALDGAASATLAIRAHSEHRAGAIQLLSSIAAETRCKTALANYDDPVQMRQAVGACNILVNATPLGMGESTQLPIALDMLRPEMTVSDLVYFPRRTRLIECAQQAGCTAVPGLGMLLHQAAAAERIWFDLDMDVDAIASQLFA